MTKKIKILIVLFSALTSALVSTLVLLIFLDSIFTRYSNDNIKKLNEVSDRFFIEVHKYLYKQIPEFQKNYCDASVVDKLRQADMNSRYLRMFEYVIDGKTLCTSYSGHITGEVYAHDIHQINPKLPLIAAYGEPKKLFLYKESEMLTKISSGNLRASFYVEDQLLSSTTWINQLVFLNSMSNEKKFFYGNTSEFPDYKKMIEAEGTTIGGWDWYYFQCYGQNTTGCGLMKVNILDYLKQNNTIISLALLLYVAVLIFFYFAYYNYAKFYKSLNRQINRGINEDRVVCYYQPIISRDESSIIGCEVLCRWIDEDGRTTYPDLFLNEIEVNGQTAELTRVVVTNAIRDLEDAEILGEITANINIFPQDIESGEIIKVLKDAVPQRFIKEITLEVTEKEVKDYYRLAKGLKKLSKMGFRLAIDDFGTGYSNFKHLQDLKVDVLKMDKSFIETIEKDTSKENVIVHIVNIAKDFDLKVVAEGVETIKQIEILDKLDVHYNQGFIYSRPTPIAEFKKYYKENPHQHF